MSTPVSIFISYAHKDETFKDELRTHLKPYERANIVKVWDDRSIIPGQEWDQEIKNHLEQSEVILFLISPDFMASGYIDEVEIKKAMARHNEKKTRIVPIVIRPSNLALLPLNHFQAVPKNAKPITTWQDRDEAWLDVTNQLGNLFKALRGGNNNSTRSTTTTPPPPPTTNKSISISIKQLILEGRIDEAIAELIEKSSNTRFEDAVIMQAGRWSRLKNDRNMGTIAESSANITTNQIVSALLSIYKDMQGDGIAV